VRARALLVVLALAAAACRSPEASRSRGGGPGADVGNRDPMVELHGGSRMYHDTPCRMPDEKCTGPGQKSGLATEFPEK
jgi:hypothetical protein